MKDNILHLNFHTLFGSWASICMIYELNVNFWAGLKLNSLKNYTQRLFRVRGGDELLVSNETMAILYIFEDIRVKNIHNEGWQFGKYSTKKEG